ncbi:MAG: ribosome biogenesis GTP-binding protein YihA/YsxC [Coprobacillus sp.]|nr:ribosome biogenesis GTP-binding protein YihA/YsxC [Coprobacillus sp.]
MINFRNTSFVKSVNDVTNKPSLYSKEVVFVGRSNVGKSSLINALVENKGIAKVSSTPGKTTLLNYFDVDHAFYLVDAPGYGYAAKGVKLAEIFACLMTSYFEKVKTLKCTFLLIDSRRGILDIDLEMIDYLNYYHIPFIIVFTKADKLTQKEKVACLKSLDQVGKDTQYLFTSSSDRKSLSTLKGMIESVL